MSRKLFVGILVFMNLNLANAQALKSIANKVDKNQTTQALDELSKLASRKQINSDLEALTRARIYFQRAELNAAIKEYQKISKSSEYWFEAQEERAHALGRQGKFNEALAALESVLAEPFHNLTGPEPYFISALTHLKICNYADVLKVSEKFKKRFSSRITNLRALIQNKTSPQLEDIRTRLQSEPLSLEVTGKHLAFIPRYLHRDLTISKNSALLSSRALTLAQAELKEIDRVITKLQIIEAEVVQRVHLAEKSKVRSTMGAIPKGSDLMIFPKDDDIWIDEIGTYATQVEKCPNPKSQVSL